MKSKNKPVKAYNMAILSDDSAEINMYGDVLMQAPRDWYTNEVIPGTYIAADEFLKDIEDIKDKANITVHINSGGGDLYAGLAIYNRLKTLPGHVTTVNDGLAASAASLIFQAGDTRKMNAGSNLMAHGAAGFLFGYYDVEDLEATVKEFKAHNNAIVNVYAEAMGVTASEAKSFIKGETWLTGQEAVDKGLADELVETDENEEENMIDKFMNKVALARFAPLGAARPISATPAAVPPIANTTTGGKDVEIKNIEELKTAFPEFVAQIENAAAKDAETQAAESERERLKAIDEIAPSIADKELVRKAKFEEPMTAGELALEAMKAQAALNNETLANIEDDAKDSGTEKVNADPEEDEEKKEEEEAKNAFAFYHKLKGGNK